MTLRGWLAVALAAVVAALGGCAGEIEGADEPGAVIIGTNVQADVAGSTVAVSGIDDGRATFHLVGSSGVAEPTEVVEGDEVRVGESRYLVRTVDDGARASGAGRDGVVVLVPERQ